jgi:uncharacterized protein YbjT (DUF2867 family)
MKNSKTLVVGSTGYLGRAVVALLADAGTPVRALVRPSRGSEVTAGFASSVEIARGDLKDPASLAAACQGVTSIVSTATATSSRLEGDSIETVDARGQESLVDAAKAAGVRRFVFVSFAESKIDFALQRAKRAVERRIEASGLETTILRPSYFMEGWLSPKLGFDPANGKAQVFGRGASSVSWISIVDVARFAAAAVTDDRLTGKVLPLGGPDALSQRDVIDLFGELGAKSIEVGETPEGELEKQRLNAKDSLYEAYAAFMLGVARGQVVDAHEALELVPGRLATVREFAARVMKSHSPARKNTP